VQRVQQTWMRLRWIPPFGLLAGHLAHGASWLVLVWVALLGEGGSLGTASLTWIHLVALGWLSVIALSILVHVIPVFTRTKWPHPLALRALLVIAVLASAGVAFEFSQGDFRAAAIAGAILSGVSISYAARAWEAVSPALREGPRARRFVAIGFLVGLGMFALTAVLGTLMAAALSGAMGPTMLTRVPAVHAHLGVLLWLTSLVFGVAVRTYNPLFGAAENEVTPHRRIAPPFTLGAIIAVLGLAFDAQIAVLIGAAIAAIATISFSAYTFSTARRATVPHRVPQAFIVAGAVWLLVATLLGFGTALGRPWAPAYLFVGLIGWLGMMVIGHMHHIGIRLLLTVRLGEDDETRPQAVLVPAYGWLAFAFFQLALLAGLAGTLGASGDLVAAGFLGFGGWVVMSLNLVAAYARAGAVRAQTEAPRPKTSLPGG
jgi:hypothetical protein